MRLFLIINGPKGGKQHKRGYTHTQHSLFFWFIHRVLHTQRSNVTTVRGLLIKEEWAERILSHAELYLFSKWPWIESVAEALLTKGALEAAEVDTLVSAYHQPPTMLAPFWRQTAIPSANASGDMSKTV